VVTIYDIRLDGCRHGFAPVIFAALLLYSAFDWYRGKRWLARDGQLQPAYSPKVGRGFFGIVAAVAFWATWGDYFHLIRAIEEHQKEARWQTEASFVSSMSEDKS
jgi:hypothetical protein